MTTVQVSHETRRLLTQRKNEERARSIDEFIQALLKPRPTLEHVRGRLKALAPALPGLGVQRIRVFGSVAADTAAPGSDVDLLVDLEDSRTYYDLARVQALFEVTMGHSCDLVVPGGLHPELREGILREAIEVWHA